MPIQSYTPPSYPVDPEMILPDEYKQKTINPILLLMLLLAGNATAVRRLLSGQGAEVKIMQDSYEALKDEIMAQQKQIEEFGKVTEDNQDDYQNLQAILVQKQSLAKMMQNQINILVKNGLETSANQQESSMDLATSLMQLVISNCASYF